MASGSRRVILAALAGNALIAVTKFTAAGLTGSSAMLSEGIHSLVDTGNQILLLYGLRRAARPPDRRFPFGHGKEVYFWSFVVAILIFAVGAGISIYEGISHLLHPEPLRNAMVNYVVLGLALVFEGGAWYFAFREFNRARGGWGYLEAVQRGKDPTLFVVLFEDSAAMAGLLVALTGVLLADLTGLMMFDGIASVVIGLILGATAVWLAWETKGLLIGEAANQRVVDGIRRLLDDSEAVVHVNEVLTMHMGPEFVLLNVSAAFRPESSAGELEAAVAALDARIKAAFPEVKRIFVEAEAWSGAAP
ncbi:MAG: cation transporter [Gammaproteobacteria bacterium]|nr:cation transporter [Gammaproteobacteria bacterium]|tara:strand:+ start:1227 stop:2144 length:918 start_codon:yes stop_codon:yes gene_type:complete